MALRTLPTFVNRRSCVSLNPSNLFPLFTSLKAQNACTRYFTSCGVSAAGYNAINELRSRSALMKFSNQNNFSSQSNIDREKCVDKARKLCGITFEIEDHIGSLKDILEIFSSLGINLTRIVSRPLPLLSEKTSFDVHFVGSPDSPDVIKAVNQVESKITGKVSYLGSLNVPWFPQSEGDIDQFSKKTLDAGEELTSDHPGFNDLAYRERRKVIVNEASKYKSGSEIPRIDYNEEEIRAWGIVYNNLRDLFPKYACSDYLTEFKELERVGVFSPKEIPQLQDITAYMQEKTGFSLRPVPGLLSGRDFLNALALRNFFATQYIRHPSSPLYTPEPDVVHELLGHAPMLCNKHFADFSQIIGLASLGATDDQITKLSSCYWFSLEFGMLFEDDVLKAFGAGLLSSIGELQFATSPTNNECEIRAWDPFLAAVTDYPITTFQPIYYAGLSMQDVKEKMLEYCQSMNKPFSVRYDAKDGRVYTDVRVRPTPVSLKF